MECNVAFFIKTHLNCKRVPKEIGIVISASTFSFPTHLSQHKVLSNIFMQFEDFIPFAVCMYSLEVYNFTLSAIIDFGKTLCCRTLWKPAR